MNIDLRLLFSTLTRSAGEVAFVIARNATWARIIGEYMQDYEDLTHPDAEATEGDDHGPPLGSSSDSSDSLDSLDSSVSNRSGTIEPQD